MSAQDVYLDEQTPWTPTSQVTLGFYRPGRSRPGNPGPWQDQVDVVVMDHRDPGSYRTITIKDFAEFRRRMQDFFAASEDPNPEIGFAVDVEPGKGYPR